MDLDFESRCNPNYEYPSLQSITVSGRSENGAIVCSLEALRLADAAFEIKNPRVIVDAFDRHTSIAHNFALELVRQRRALGRLFGDRGVFASGLIGVLSIDTSTNARGHRNGLKLLNQLRELHAGMEWFVALQAAPQEDDFKSQSFLDMRRRLINYYASDKKIRLAEVSPKASPGLMVGLWS
jgi:hypothetical protein